MAKRLISAAIAVPLGILVLWLDNTLLLTTLVTVFAVLATYEMLLATKYLQNKLLTAVSLSFVLVIPYIFYFPEIKQWVVVISFAYVILLFAIYLFMHEKVKFEEVAVVAFISIGLPLAFSTIPFIRLRFQEHGLFFVVFALLTVWIGDAGAFFTGTFLGKHKMAPRISPKKTWEGFAGGVVTSGVFGLLLGVLYEPYLEIVTGNEYSFAVNIPYLVIVAIVASVLGVMGDLSASIVKRQCAVKDFGNILPGHGGVLDRFDSIIFSAPFIYLMFQIYNPIS